MRKFIMTLGKVWAGSIYGTNTGKIFVKLDGDEEALTGTLRLNEPGVGLIEYKIAGSFVGDHLTFTGEPQTQIEGVDQGELEATATLSQTGSLEGEWETSIGSAGIFTLFPHDSAPAFAPGERTLNQLHTARHNFGAVEIDSVQITALAEEIQREFPRGSVIVTVIEGSEQSLYLDDFKALNFGSDRAEFIKIFVQEPEGNGINRVVSVEFGQQANQAMTQGSNEAWVLGRLEKLKRNLQQYERFNSIKFKRLDFGINQLLFVGAIVFLPSLENLRDRTILMAGVFALMITVNWLHRRYLPFAAIYLSKKPRGFLARVAPSLGSWIIAVLAGVAAALLAGYLEGWLTAFFVDQ